MGYYHTLLTSVALFWPNKVWSNCHATIHLVIALLPWKEREMHVDWEDKLLEKAIRETQFAVNNLQNTFGNKNCILME